MPVLARSGSSSESYVITLILDCVSADEDSRAVSDLKCAKCGGHGEEHTPNCAFR